MDERICRKCPRLEACPKTANRTCLHMAEQTAIQMADRVERLERMLIKALDNLREDHMLGRCAFCAHKYDPPERSDADGFMIAAKCRACASGSEWTWNGMEE